MRNENIIYLDPFKTGREKFEKLIKEYGRGSGHSIVASIENPIDVQKIADGIDPSVAIIGVRGNSSSCRFASTLLKRRYPQIAIVALSVNGPEDWADLTIDMNTADRDLVNYITTLEH